jgi:hypothetical protein
MVALTHDGRGGMAGGRKYTEEEIRTIALSVYQGESTAETVARIQAMSPDRSKAAILKARHLEAVDELVSRWRTGQEEPPDKPKVQSRVEVEGLRVKPEELWESAKAATSRQIAYQKERHQAQIGFLSNKPVGISFISDQHISQGGAVNLEQMEADAELVRDTPGLYAVLGGDGTDNHLKHRAAMVNSGSVPGKEWAMYDHYLGIFGSSLVAMISGNHDDWTHDFAGVDVVQMLADRHRVFYAPDYVVLKVQLQQAKDGPATEYVIKIRHQYRYGSSFNQTHSIKRLWEMDDHDFDVGVLCHHHEAALEPFRKHGVWRWALRPGSYQHMTGHSRRYGFGWSEPKCPTVILYPEERRIVGFLDVRDAAVHLRALRMGVAA